MPSLGMTAMTGLIILIRTRAWQLSGKWKYRFAFDLIQFVSFLNKMMPRKTLSLSHLFRLLLGHVHQGPVKPPHELCVVSLDHIAVGDLPPNIRPVGCKHEWVWKQTNTASLEGNSVKSSKIFNASHLTLTQDTGVWYLTFLLYLIHCSKCLLTPPTSPRP